LKKVLITGSSGFVGRNLTKKLDELNVEYLALNSSNCNLRDNNALIKYISSPESFDTIIHLAAWTRPGDFCDVRRGEQFLVNQQINTNVLSFWKEKAPQAKMIGFGTSVSYTSEDDLREINYMAGIPSDSFYAYAMCKRMLLVGLECLNKQFGLDYLYFVPSTVYGPSYHTDNRQNHFIYDLIKKILKGKMNGDKVVLWGNGEQTRELIFVDDFVNSILEVNKATKNEIVNLGTGKAHTIKDFARFISRIIDYDENKIEYDITKPTGAKSKVLNVEKLNSLLQNKKFLTIEDGLKMTINWVKENNLI